MEKAKAAIKDFTSRSGHHDTTVHETVAPSVKHETVKPHQHEDVQTAVDKEVHQDHYHRTVQPVQDREVLPEKHTAQLGAVQHREFDHRDHEHTQRALATGQNEFKDKHQVTDTTHSQSAAPVVAGEHVHHHLHETIQPVVHKETVQPHVVHTTVPIHETHHNAARHHDTTELPPVSMNEYKHHGGVLGGREERFDGFEGEPKNIGGMLKDIKHHHKHDSGHDHAAAAEQVPGGPYHGDYNPLDGKHSNHRSGNGVESKLERAEDRATRHEAEKTGSRGVGGAAGVGGTGAGGLGAGAGGVTSNSSATSSHANQQHKPSLMDKLNPKRDADGDGKTGIMD